MSIDIEDEVRKALKDYLSAYCRPLPKSYNLPNILIHRVGGTEVDTIDTFEVVLDSRAKTDTEADEYLRKAIGILQKQAKLQSTAIRHITINTIGTWGTDPVRPDLKMCSARVRILAHTQNTEV